MDLPAERAEIAVAKSQINSLFKPKGVQWDPKKTRCGTMALF